MQTTLKKLCSLAMWIALALGLSQCSTIKGFGQDVQKAGDSISNAASRAAN
ncbi:MAG: entericidin A/B family lipoprotein [Verrucomicrobia bacterium]|jgi:predicted small secreted protein|nr:MAG: entericidin A/B family lipoprotein [Verrucomicrobiota bacterium]